MDRVHKTERFTGLSVGTFAVCSTLVAATWTLLLGVVDPSPRSVQATFVLVAVGTAAQLLHSWWRGSPTRWAGTRTYSASQIWFGGAVAWLAVVTTGRIVPVQVSAMSALIAALAATLVLAVADEVSLGLRGNAKTRRAVFIGTGEETAEWFELLRDHPEIGIEVVGCVGDAQIAHQTGLSAQWLGDTCDLLHIMERSEIDLPVVSVTSFRRPSVTAIVDRLLDAKFDVVMSWGVGRLSSARLGSTVVGHESLPVIRAQRVRPIARTLMRCVDIVVSVVLLTITAPLVFVSAVLVRTTSPGHAFFRQTRVGLNGKTFKVIKLRTMSVDAEAQRDALLDDNERSGPLFKLARDPRVTPVGRVLRALSIDELPQLVNVLKGDMALIGPRPALVDESARFDAELLARTAVRPGLSGLWQVEARSNEAFGAYRRLDLHYLENWSPALDFRLMIATAQMLVIGGLVSPIVGLIRPRFEPKATEAPSEPAPTSPRPARVTDISRARSGAERSSRGPRIPRTTPGSATGG